MKKPPFGADMIMPAAVFCSNRGKDAPFDGTGFDFAGISI
jgi:hypothetical protein